MAQKQKWKKRSWEEKRERINKITEEIDKQVNSYYETPEQMKEYLSFMAKFYNYSPKNTALIHSQFRGAKAVGSFKFWKDKGFSVKKGEKGIQVLVPNKTAPKFKDEKGKWKNIKYATEQEKKLIEHGVLEVRKSKLYFSLGHVFDISQTNAKAEDLPEIFPNKWMEGKVDNYNALMNSFKKIADDLNVTVGDPLDELGTAKGAFYHAIGKDTVGHIGINPRNSELQNVKTMIHELAHAKLHAGDKGLKMSTEEKEFQAEMVACATSSYFGIDTSEYSLKYLANWTQGKELDDKAKLLTEVRETAVEFIHAIEEELVKEREKTSELENNIMLLIKYDMYGSTENEYLSIKDLRAMVASEKTRKMAKGLDSDHTLIQRANQLMTDEDLTPREWSGIFNEIFKDHYAVIDSETLTKPTVLIQWSEAWPEKNIVLSFKRANKKMENHIKEIEKAKQVAEKEGRYVGYDKTRYHVLLPNDKGYIDVLNMDRLDMGDGEFKSPYEQVLKEMKIADSQKVILYNEVFDQTLNKNILSEIKKSYLEFVENEYSSDADEENLQNLKKKAKEIDLNSVIPVAYTTVGNNDEFELKVSLNLEEKRLERVISGEYVSEKDYYHYDSYEEIVNDIKEWDFDNLTENNFDYDELSQKEIVELYRLFNKKSKEMQMEM